MVPVFELYFLFSVPYFLSPKTYFKFSAHFSSFVHPYVSFVLKVHSGCYFLLDARRSVAGDALRRRSPATLSAAAAVAERSAAEAPGALLIAEGAKRSSPTPSTRDRILGVRGGPGAPPGNVRRRHRNANAN